MCSPCTRCGRGSVPYGEWNRVRYRRRQNQPRIPVRRYHRHKSCKSQKLPFAGANNLVRFEQAYERCLEYRRVLYYEYTEDVSFRVPDSETVSLFPGLDEDQPNDNNNNNSEITEKMKRHATPGVMTFVESCPNHHDPDDEHLHMSQWDVWNLVLGGTRSFIQLIRGVGYNSVDNTYEDTPTLPIPNTISWRFNPTEGKNWCQLCNRTLYNEGCCLELDES